jgi:hypothetical protein
MPEGRVVQLYHQIFNRFQLGYMFQSLNHKCYQVILVINQLDALFSIYLFHFSTCFEQPSAHHQENQLYQYIIWYISLWQMTVRYAGQEGTDRHTRQSSTTVIYTR